MFETLGRQCTFLRDSLLSPLLVRVSEARGVLFLEKTITCNIVRVLLGPLPSPSLVAAVFADDEKSGERRSKAERGREKGGESFRKGVALTYKRVCLAFLFLRSRTMKDELGVHKGGCIARMDFSPPPSFLYFHRRREGKPGDCLSVCAEYLVYEIEGCAFQFNARDSPRASRYVSLTVERLDMGDIDTPNEVKTIRSLACRIRALLVSTSFFFVNNFIFNIFFLVNARFY